MQTQLVFANLPKSALKLFVPDQCIGNGTERSEYLYLITIDSRSGTDSPANCNSLQYQIKHFKSHFLPNIFVHQQLKAAQNQIKVQILLW